MPQIGCSMALMGRRLEERVVDHAMPGRRDMPALRPSLVSVSAASPVMASCGSLMVGSGARFLCRTGPDAEPSYIRTTTSKVAAVTRIDGTL